MTDRSSASVPVPVSASVSVSDPPTTGYDALDEAIDAAGAVGFVAVGGRFDPDLRYLTRFDGPEDGYAFVRVPGRSVLCAPAGYLRRAAASFGGRVVADRAGEPAGERAAAVLDDRGGDGSGSETTVLVPRTIPHDAAVHLERAGYDLRSTTAVAEARGAKADGEVDAIAAVQRAAAGAVRETERLLATADVDDGRTLGPSGEPLTAERLRRATNAELARRGVTDAGNTVVRAGPDAAAGGRSRGAAGDAPIRAGEPVTLVVAPHGPHGYHGSLARTVVVDSDGGWDRRAYVAAESALTAALAAIEPGAAASAVGREVDAELAAFGFADGAADISATPGHGVGLSRRERPRLDAGGDAKLAPGHVVAVAPAVADPEHGVVRLSTLVVVTPDGYERVGDGDRSFAPRG